MTQKLPASVSSYPVQIWLAAVAVMVFLMAVIGAITRLTESGLSITEWNVVSGTLPPLNEAEWMAVFEKYKLTPEYVQQHFWMELDDFKKIFFWEWLHRLWGRLIGVAFALPLIWFWVRKQIPTGYKPHLLFLLALGGAQGLMGWVMVQSGLVDRPDVSHYRLAAHLFLAFLIFAAILWVLWDIRSHEHPVTLEVTPSFCLIRHGWIALALVAVTICWGAFVAGLGAGKIYNSWPFMGKYLLPVEFQQYGYTAHTFLETHEGVQFFHRWIAILTLFVVGAFAWRAKAGALAGMVFVQVLLGIVTLLSGVAIAIATAHQAGAFILVALLLYQLHALQQAYKPKA